jgi:hypothetical protein
LNRTGFSESEKQALLSPQGLVLHSFHKYDPKTTAGPIPTINVLALPNGTKSDKEFLMALKSSFERRQSLLPDFAYEVEPRLIKSGALSAVEMIVRFALPTRDGSKVSVRARTLAIPVGSALIQFSFTEPTTESNDKVYAAFEGSIVVQGP